MRFPHDWQAMASRPGVLFCTRCGVVQALCGTDMCSAADYPPGPNVQPPAGLDPEP